MVKRLTNDYVTDKIHEKYGYLYDVSKVNYINDKTKITLMCPIHGEFEQRFSHLMNGHCCPKCSAERRAEKRIIPISEVKKRFKEVHGDKYSYDFSTYKNASTPMRMICPIHGEFYQTPKQHYLNKQGCSKCGIIEAHNKQKKSLKEFIEDARKVHDDKYDYSKSVYINAIEPILIHCNVCGNDFKQTPNSHLNGAGCPICGRKKAANSMRLEQDKFIEQARNVHGNKYNYSKVKYIDSHTNVTIICPIHGEFQQTPNNHLHGRGCAKCNSSHLENDIRLLLQENNIEFEEQKMFDWLGYKSLDFYLSNKNIAIECQGMQHYKPIKWFGGDDGLYKQKSRDIEKKELCNAHNIEIFYYSDENYGDELLITDKNKLLEEINKVFKL